MTNEEIKIKNQKRTIIALSIILSIFIAIFIGKAIYDVIDVKSIDISITNYYNKQLSFYTCYDVEITCKENKIINVNDFTFKNDNKNIIVSKIDFNNKEYNTNESFTIYKNQTNNLTLYITLENENPKIIYYKFKQIKLGETKHFII